VIPDPFILFWVQNQLILKFWSCGISDFLLLVLAFVAVAMNLMESICMFILFYNPSFICLLI
jgi:hypothetical protein